MDGWNTTFLLGRPIFRGYVSFREGSHWTIGAFGSTSSRHLRQPKTFNQAAWTRTRGFSEENTTCCARNQDPRRRIQKNTKRWIHDEIRLVCNPKDQSKQIEAGPWQSRQSFMEKTARFVSMIFNWFQLTSNGHRFFAPFRSRIFCLIQETLLHRNDAKPGSYHLRCVAGPQKKIPRILWRWQGRSHGWWRMEDGW